MTRCSCGRFNARGTLYCPGCGKTVNRTICLAENCGAENPLDARFCQKCGSDRLTKGAPAKSLWFLPPLTLAALCAAGGAVLWVTGLPQAVGANAVYAWGRLQQYLYAAGAIAIIGSYLFFFVPEGVRSSVLALLRLWTEIAKSLVGLVTGLLVGIRKAFARAPAKKDKPDR